MPIHPAERSLVQLPGSHTDLPEVDAVIDGPTLRVHGWAATPAGPCARVEITVDGRSIGRARLGGYRPDVAEETGVASSAFSGFELVVPTFEVGPPSTNVILGGRGIGIDGVVAELTGVPVALGRRVQWEPPAVIEPLARRAPRDRRPGDSAGMRVLVCAHDLERRGAPRFVTWLIEEIAAHGSITGAVVAFGDGPMRERFEALGFEVLIADPIGVGSVAEYDAGVAGISDWIETQRPDVALVNSFVALPGAEACSRLGIPIVWAIHESYPLPIMPVLFGDFDPRVHDQALATISGAAALAFLSQSTRACYEPYLPAARCVTLSSAIDVTALERWRIGFDRDAGRRERGIPDDTVAVLCIGSIEPSKGQIPLIQAFAQVADAHPKAQLRLVGGRGDRLEDAARAASASFGVQDRIEIVPFVADPRPEYACADVLVSASDLESLPLTILEAMALRLPVLATAAFGMGELIADGSTGWLVAPRDVQWLAAALDRVLSANVRERSAIAERAYAMVCSEHRADLCARAWSDLLHEAAGL